MRARQSAGGLRARQSTGGLRGDQSAGRLRWCVVRSPLLRRFDFWTLALALISGAALLSLAKVAADSFLLYFSPRRADYRLFVASSSPDFSPDNEEEREVCTHPSLHPRTSQSCVSPPAGVRAHACMRACLHALWSLSARSGPPLVAVTEWCLAWALAVGRAAREAEHYWAPLPPTSACCALAPSHPTRAAYVQPMRT